MCSPSRNVRLSSRAQTLAITLPRESRRDLLCNNTAPISSQSAEKSRVFRGFVLVKLTTLITSVKTAFSSGLICLAASASQYDAVRPRCVWRDPLDKCTQSLILSCHGPCSIRANTHTVLPFQCSESSETQHTEGSFFISYQIHCDSKTETGVLVCSRFGFWWIIFHNGRHCRVSFETLRVFLFAPVKYLSTLQTCTLYLSEKSQG